MCSTLQIQWNELNTGSDSCVVIRKYGNQNGYPFWVFDVNGFVEIRLWCDGNIWRMTDEQSGLTYYEYLSNVQCPITNLSNWNQQNNVVNFTSFSIAESQMDCGCAINMNIVYKTDPYDLIMYPQSTLNGKTTFNLYMPNASCIVFFDGIKWMINDMNNQSVNYAQLNTNVDCPVGQWQINDPSWFGLVTFMQTSSIACPIPTQCDCGIQTNVVNNGVGEIWEWLPVGELNGMLVYQYTLNGELLSMWNDGDISWQITIGDIMIGENNGQLTGMKQNFGRGCPVTFDGLHEWEPNAFESKGDVITQFDSIGIACALDCGREDRFKKYFTSIKLPQQFTEQNRGMIDCCCEYMVLASGGSETWTNDITSAWMKLSDPNDSVTFKLIDSNGGATNYTPTPQPFINEPNAFFTTIQWKDVLVSDGEGCYTLNLEYNISGITGIVTWGMYKLQKYTIQNALKTARIRAKFNGKHEIDGIDFTASNVESTFRFYGFIGSRQPNTEIDNIIYSDRQMKRVIRENLNQYEITTDPSNECIIKPLIDLFLLSENEMWISDYNAHNHSYRYNDIPVIVEESPKIEYKEFSRLAELSCVVSDKFKNQRTYFNGN